MMVRILNRLLVTSSASATVTPSYQQDIEYSGPSFFDGWTFFTVRRLTYYFPALYWYSTRDKTQQMDSQSTLLFDLTGHPSANNLIATFDEPTANESGLINTFPNGTVYLGVDATVLDPSVAERVLG